MAGVGEQSSLPEPEAAWRAAVAKVLQARGGWFADDVTADGIPVLPLYPPSRQAAPQPMRLAGPFGIVQRVDHPDRDQAHALLLADLQGGAGGLTLVAEGAGSARGFGLAIHSDQQLDAVLDGVDIEAIALRLEGSADAFDLGAALSRLARRRGCDPHRLDIDFGDDPIGTMARRGGSPWAQEGDTRRFVAQRREGFVTPVFRTDGRPYHEAGATEAQELAAVIATGVAYLRWLEAARVPLDEARGAVSHLLVADVDLVPTIAKFRAFRRLWARVEEASGLVPRPARLHGETAWRALTRRDPWTNILRGTIGCAGALLGGADSVTILPFTSALGMPDAAARRLARNTALILLDESHLARVADPTAGAGAIEALTEGLCEEGWRLFQAIERDGGLPQALLSGSWQRQIAAARERRAMDVATGKQSLTGTSLFANLAETLPSVLAPAAADENSQAPSALPSIRDAKPFESFQDRSDAWLARHGRRPQVAVATTCSAFARSALEIGGFEIAEVNAAGARIVESLFVEGCDLVAALETLWNEVSIA